MNHYRSSEAAMATDSTEFIGGAFGVLRKPMSIALFFWVVIVTFGMPGFRWAHTSVQIGRTKEITSGHFYLLDGSQVRVHGRAPVLMFWRNGRICYPLGRL